MLLRLVSLSTWHSLVSAAKREVEFKGYPQLLKFWKHLEKKFDALGKDSMLLMATRLQLFVLRLVSDSRLFVILFA